MESLEKIVYQLLNLSYFSKKELAGWITSKKITKRLKIESLGLL